MRIDLDNKYIMGKDAYLRKTGESKMLLDNFKVVSGGTRPETTRYSTGVIFLQKGMGEKYVTDTKKYYQVNKSY